MFVWTFSGVVQAVFMGILFLGFMLAGMIKLIDYISDKRRRGNKK